MFISYFHTKCYTHSPTDTLPMGIKLKAKENFSFCTTAQFIGSHPYYVNASFQHVILSDASIVPNSHVCVSGILLLLKI
jgi:hypothetical protein